MTLERRSPRGDAALLLCTAIWGATFPLVRFTLAFVSPLTLIATRFALAGLVVLPWGLRAGLPALRRALPWGTLAGVVLALSFLLQTLGLERIGSARSAFITSFYALFTALFEWLLVKQAPSWRVALGAALAVLGGAVMTGSALGAPPSAGDLMTLACAAGFGLHLVVILIALRRHSSAAILQIQITVCALISAGGVLTLEDVRFASTPAVWGALAFLGVLATVGCLALQNYGQVRTTATRAAVILSAEPLFATAFAAFVGERPTASELIGGAIILAGVLCATLPVGRRQVA